MAKKKRNSTGGARSDAKPERDEQVRREQRNLNHRDHEPESKDPMNPASKPQGTTADQIANMESEGQAQEAVNPEDKD